VYVSRSGGKDSDVLGHLVKEMYPDVPHVFVNTGLEHDSVRLHGEEVADVVLRPQMNFVDVITKYGYPVISKEVSKVIHEIQRMKARGESPKGWAFKKISGELINKKTGELSPFNIPHHKFLLEAPFRISDRCCDVMKKSPVKKYGKYTGNKAFIGTLASESARRKQKWLKSGCNAFEEKTPTSQPLSFWTEQDILQYIKQEGIKIADAYGDICYKDKDGMTYADNIFTPYMELETTGAKRTGCVFCMFGIRQDTDRFLRLKETEPKKYDYVMRGGKFDEQGMWIPHQGLGYKFVIDWLNEHGNLNIKY
jgi:3'-phosphoadenosine 5'-phosphosulfate sulfotransferase (PAPS reductase)/FAD synthetase